jgi:IclR family pca regulon transcriptional regulator
VRAQGWALVDGELEAGLRSVAAPVHGKDGAVAAAINVSSSATRDTVYHLVEEYVPRLLATAAAIDADLRLV